MNYRLTFLILYTTVVELNRYNSKNLARYSSQFYDRQEKET